jgi:hypothetical protein
MQFPTTTPEATLAIAIEFLREKSRGELRAVGIGSFGPIDLHSTSAKFGYVTSTPKAGWQNYNLAGTVRDALGVLGFFIEDQSHLALQDPTHAALLTGMVEAARQREYAVTVLVAAPASTDRVVSTLRKQLRVAGVLLSLQGAEGERPRREVVHDEESVSAHCGGLKSLCHFGHHLGAGGKCGGQNTQQRIARTEQ